MYCCIYRYIVVFDERAERVGYGQLSEFQELAKMTFFFGIIRPRRLLSDEKIEIWKIVGLCVLAVDVRTPADTTSSRSSIVRRVYRYRGVAAVDGCTTCCVQLYTSYYTGIRTTT